MSTLSIRTGKLHTISGHVILLGLFFISYGILFNITLIISGVIVMACGSCINIVSMRSYQELIEEEEEEEEE
jgi:Kef-type K+ transport system membrane component KefB